MTDVAKNALQNYKLLKICWGLCSVCSLDVTLVLSALTGTCLHDIPGRNFEKCVAFNELKLNGNNRLKMPQQISRNKRANRDPCACLQGFVQLTAFSPHELHGQSTSILLHWKSSPANHQLCHLRKALQTGITQMRRSVHSCCFCCFHRDNSLWTLLSICKNDHFINH